MKSHIRISLENIIGEDFIYSYFSDATTKEKKSYRIKLIISSEVKINSDLIGKISSLPHVTKVKTSSDSIFSTIRVFFDVNPSTLSN